MIDKLIDKYGAILNTLRENKSTKIDTDLYDYNNDIKNMREYLKDLKALKQQLTIPVVSNFVIQEIERRRDLILSEPDGIVREQMINNLALEL